MHQHRIKCSQTNYLKSPGLGACTKVTSSHHHGLHQVSGWRSYFYNFYLGIWLSNAYVLLNITQNSRCELMFCSCSRLFLNGPCESYQNGGLLVTYAPLKRSYYHGQFLGTMCFCKFETDNIICESSNPVPRAVRECK